LQSSEKIATSQSAQILDHVIFCVHMSNQSLIDLEARLKSIYILC